VEGDEGEELDLRGRFTRRDGNHYDGRIMSQDL
jgi:hypothetical protein